MRTELALVTFALCAMSSLCLAAGAPLSADEILRLNPQIKSLAGLPPTLKGMSIQNCPAGRTPDISSSLCVSAYAPGQPSQGSRGGTQAFIFILYPRSSKVWLVFQSETNPQRPAVLLGEFGQNGVLIRDKQGLVSSAGSRPVTTDSPQVPRQAAISQPNQKWAGTWKSEDGDKSLTISASKIDAVAVDRRETGRPEELRSTYRWTRSAQADAVNDHSFGYAKKRKSPAEVSKLYEEAVRQYQSDPTDFVISDPPSSRKAIAAITPGTYDVLWVYEGGDCGEYQYIVDGDKMLEFGDCKYGFRVQLFRRTLR